MFSFWWSLTNLCEFTQKSLFNKSMAQFLTQISRIKKWILRKCFKLTFLKLQCLISPLIFLGNLINYINLFLFTMQCNSSVFRKKILKVEIKNRLKFNSQLLRPFPTELDSFKIKPRGTPCLYFLYFNAWKSRKFEPFSSSIFQEFQRRKCDRKKWNKSVTGQSPLEMGQLGRNLPALLFIREVVKEGRMTLNSSPPI